MTKRILVAFALAVLYSHATLAVSPRAEIEACKRVVDEGFRPIAVDRADRFLGKVQKDTALCRGGERALKYVDTPWVDWSSYWATGRENPGAGARGGDPVRPACVTERARCRRQSDRSRVSAHRADQVQPV